MARFRIVHNTNSVVYRTDEHVGQISSCKIGCNISDIQSDFSYQPLWTTYSTFDVISKERLCCYPLTLRPSKTYVNNWCSRVALKQLHCVVFSQKGHGCSKDFLLVPHTISYRRRWWRRNWRSGYAQRRRLRALLPRQLPRKPPRWEASADRCPRDHLFVYDVRSGWRGGGTPKPAECWYIIP